MHDVSWCLWRVVASGNARAEAPRTRRLTMEVSVSRAGERLEGPSDFGGANCAGRGARVGLGRAGPVAAAAAKGDDSRAASSLAGACHRSSGACATISHRRAIDLAALLALGSSQRLGCGRPRSLPASLPARRASKENKAKHNNFCCFDNKQRAASSKLTPISNLIRNRKRNRNFGLQCTNTYSSLFSILTHKSNRLKRLKLARLKRRATQIVTPT